MESPEINPHTSAYLIYNKETRIYNEDKTVSSVSGAWKTGPAACNRMKLEHSPATQK